MGWLYRQDITRKELIAERTQSWERQSGETLVTSTCLANCYRGNSFSGVLWAVWERTFTKDGKQLQPTERWIICDLLQYQRDCGWGYKDMDESIGPYHFSCPLKYLDMVPTERFGGNKERREEVRQHHQRKVQTRRQKAITQTS